MKKLLSLFLIVGLILTSTNLYSHGLKEINFNSRVNQSQLIIEGKVISKRSFWDLQNHNIYTASKVEIYKVFKGTVNTTVLEIITPGGTVGLQHEEVCLSLELTRNDVGIFMLKNNTVNTMGIRAVPVYEPYASVQGFIKYDLIDKKASGPFDRFNNIDILLYNSVQSITNSSYVEIQPFSVNQKGKISNKLVPSISSFSPGTVTAGTGTQLTINGSGFGSSQGTSVVQFADANDGGAGFFTTLASQTVSWSSTQIIVEVPDRAGTGNIRVIVGGSSATSGSSLTVSWAVLNIESDALSAGDTVAYETQHVDDDASGGYTWQMFTDFDANASANASFVRAMDSWRCTGTSVNWSIGAVTGTDVVANDGINIIRDDNGGELPVGVLGRCTSRYSGCFESSTLHWYVFELDIVFDDGANWNYGPAAPAGGEYDFETVAVHELGHGHQLAHVISPGAIMHYSIGSGTQNRTPGANDLAAGNDVMSRSTTQVYCGNGLMTNYSSCGAAPVAAFSAGSTTLCAGSSTIFTDASTNTPTGWTWVFSPATVTYINSTTSASQNPDVQFNAAGNYTVTLTASNGSGSDDEIKTNYITVDDVPGAAGAITGSIAECDNATGVPYSISAVADATGYTWAVPTGATVATGQGTISITVDFGTTSGNVTVTPNNSCGNGGTGILAVTISSCTPGPDIYSIHCNRTLASENIFSNCIAMAGATQYEFQITDQGTGSQVSSVVRGSTYFKFAHLSGWAYNTTYDLSVRAFVSGSWTDYGTACPVTSPGIPVPSIYSSHCNRTLASDNVFSNCTVISSATQYEFQLQEQGSGSQVCTVVRGSSYFKFKHMTGWVINTTYDLSARAFIGGSWTAYGPTCPVTSPSVITRMGIFDEDEEFDREISDNYDVNSLGVNSLLEMNIYPNPSQGEFVYIELQGLSADAELIVYDIFGKTVLNQPINSDYGNYNETLRFHKKLDAGFYLITVVSGDQKTTKKLIVQ